MEELTYKDLNEAELDTLKDMYISSRVNSMTESDLRKFVKEIFIDHIKILIHSKYVTKNSCSFF